MTITTHLQAELTDSKSFASFRTSIRAAIRGLYNEVFTLFDFVDAMRSAITRSYGQAWNEGAAECGIKPDELTNEEINRRDTMINEATFRLVDFGHAIIEGRDDKPISTFFTRGDMWANRWFEVVNLAKTLACQNEKLRWDLGDAEHCSTCLKLSGRVMRANRWQQLDVWPRDTRTGRLECRGFNCQCQLTKTDAKATPGKLPGLP